MSSTDQARIRILVVDDEYAIAFSLAQILQRAGYETQTATGGEDALRIADRFRPDLLLTDYAMPGMDGLTLAVHIKKLLPGCRIVLLSGHELNLASAPYESKGYHFTLLKKPLHPKALLDVLDNQVPASYLTAVHPKVLHVDDMETHRYSVTRLLQHAGFDVMTAANGSEAIAMATSESPDLVLLDVHLPDINGFEVCRRLKQRPETSRMPIVHITATAKNQESADQSVRAGANGFITEPFIPSELVAKLRSYIQLQYASE